MQDWVDDVVPRRSTRGRGAAAPATAGRCRRPHRPIGTGAAGAVGCRRGDPQVVGIGVREMPHVRHVHPVHAYLAGADEGRAEDFSIAWAAPDVRAIMCARGGYGAQRMPIVDWSACATSSRRCCSGTAMSRPLQEAVAAARRRDVARTDVGHTVVPRLGSRPGALADDLVRARVGAGVVTTVGAPLVGGTAVGVTTGGCLSVLSMSVATPTAHSRPAAESCCSRTSTSRPTGSTRT